MNSKPYMPNFKEEQSAKIPALTLLTNLGYQFIPPSECLTMRGNCNTVILPGVLRSVLKSKTFEHYGENYHLSEESINSIFKELIPPVKLDSKTPNEYIYDKLTYGIPVKQFEKGQIATPTIQLIDWENPENNVFHFTEEMEINRKRTSKTRIPDIICFVNGLPWVVIEAKRPNSTNSNKSTLSEGISQNIRNQKDDEIPHLFAYSQILFAINGSEGKYATYGTPEKFWASWKEEEISEENFKALKNKTLSDQQLNAIFDHRDPKLKAEYEALIAGGNLVVTDQDRLLISLLRHDRLLELTHLFNLFDSKKGRIIARYQQYFGIKALIERITTFDEKGARNGGVIWHTTGSGKSLTMVFLSKALVWFKELAQFRVIVVTDRVDLEKQLANTFASSGALSRFARKNSIAKSGYELAKQIGQGNQRILFSIINKFGTAIKHPICHNDSSEILVLIDEGHRSQNGENHAYMKKALPNAAYIAFTGTPLLKDDKTQNKFGKIIHSYTMQEAENDKAVTPLLYEDRMVELDINEKPLDASFDRLTKNLTEKQKADLKRKYSNKGTIYHVEDRLNLIAHNISEHFPKIKSSKLKGQIAHNISEHSPKIKSSKLKGQLACDSKTSAIRYKKLLDKIGKVTSVVVISPPDMREGYGSVEDENKELVQNWWKENILDKGWTDEKVYTQHAIQEFSKEDGPDIIIVVDKLLTGFDEPRNAVLYIDKPLKNHTLLQAIARVNRLHENKQFGYLIDYRGILKELDTTIEKYQNLAEKTQSGFDINDIQGLYKQMESEYKKLPKLYDALWAIFKDVNNKQDGQALRQFLAPKIENIHGHFVDVRLKRRNDFYLALTAFTNCLRVALQSNGYFDDTFFDDKRELYKDTLKSMVQLRQQVKADTNETIDYGDYEQDIRSMLDKHIGGVDVIASEGLYNLNKLGQHSKSIEDSSPTDLKTQKDVITGRISKMIEEELDDDPYAKEHFSKLLKDAIERTKGLFNSSIKDILDLETFEEQVKNRNIETFPQDKFSKLDPKIQRHVKAYYGLFFKILGDNNQLTEEQQFQYALDINTIVNNVVATHSLNPSDIEDNICVEIMPLLYLDMGVEKAKMLVDEVVKITNLGLAN